MRRAARRCLFRTVNMRMTFKGYELVLFFVLAVVLLPGVYAPDYQTFLKQHYNNPKSNVGNCYCDTMMERRKMTRPIYKDKNSIIHDNKKSIINVCGSGGQPYGNGLRRSRNRFSVTTCKHRGGSNYPPCSYSETTSSRLIVVRCAGRRPVYFDESQI
ncbi:angiogenin-2-like isoform X2 [Ahaetulla prasina]|uniref:angiogenin-2-like isoform X2 n=1 Tax=Ahaetulla prasina TaxID=499056 RepID=UPI00264A0772|nr:angiogenin-2-like isoform X2 [Ahaetulla prasina]